MTKRFFIVIFLISFLPGIIAAQFVPNLSGFSKSTLSKARADLKVNYMTLEEQNVIFYMNLVRLQPKIFLETIVRPYIKEYEMENNSFAKSLIKDLKKSKSVGVLKPKKDLFEVAEKHRMDIGENGILGHVGSNHNTFKKRAAGIMRVYDGAGECIGFGYDSAIQNVIELLIDKGVRSLGHRKTILNGEYNWASSSIGYHSNYGSCCVIDYGI